jgi:translation initiation factor IF-2
MRHRGGGPWAGQRGRRRAIRKRPGLIATRARRPPFPPVTPGRGAIRRAGPRSAAGGAGRRRRPGRCCPASPADSAAGRAMAQDAAAPPPPAPRPGRDDEPGAARQRGGGGAAGGAPAATAPAEAGSPLRAPRRGAPRAPHRASKAELYGSSPPTGESSSSGFDSDEGAAPGGAGSRSVRQSAGTPGVTPRARRRAPDAGRGATRCPPRPRPRPCPPPPPAP